MNDNVILEIKQELSCSRIERDKKLLSGDDKSFLEQNAKVKALEWVLRLFKRYENE